MTVYVKMKPGPHLVYFSLRLCTKTDGQDLREKRCTHDFEKIMKIEPHRKVKGLDSVSVILNHRGYFCC